MNLPRSVFSEAQLELYMWGLQENGVDFVPSVSMIKDIQKLLQTEYGIKTIRYSGALGHTYYVNDIGGIISQVRTS
jgi:hypothetical protein